MMPSLLVRQTRRGLLMPRSPVAVVTLALLAGGCSADVTRFDFPAFNLNGNTETTAAIPRPSEPMSTGRFEAAPPPPPASQGDWRDGAYRPPGEEPRGGMRMSALPDATPSQPPAASRTEPTRAAAPVASAPRSVYEEPIARGEEIVVEPGDTLYGLSRRHGVALSELMAVNGLSGPVIRPGQRLHLPAGTSAAASSRSSEPTTVAESLPSSTAPSDWAGTHTVAPGDSLYKLARQYNVKSAELQRVNGITDPRRIRPGTVLKVPGEGSGSDPQASRQMAATPEPATAEPAARIPSTTQPTIINSNRRVAALPSEGVADTPPAQGREEAVAPTAKPVQVVTVSPAGTGAGKLRWPVQGKVISGFGPRSDGTHNDGINLSVPLGTEVHAAEDGVVAYAGSELKGYGNLVLVRHDNGWVTAYAHNDEMLVKRGDKVTRGQVIAKAGKTGQVDQPQVHFELRQGAKPVDPIPFLERI